MKIPPTVSGRRGFSLVEVTMALGLASFALVAMYGMLPVSLQTIKQGDDRMMSVQIFRSMAEGVRSPIETNSVFQLNGAFARTFQEISWRVDGPDVILPATRVGEAGQPGSSFDRYVLAGRITPPKSDGTAGVVRLSVAWPPSANFDSSDFSWKNAMGSREFVMNFVPKNP